MFMKCPECGARVVPIHYGHVDFSVIEKVIIGDLVIGYRYGLEKWHCKNCNQSYSEIE